MNLWLSASLVLVCGFVPCIWVAARSDVGSGLAALSVAGVITVVVLMTLTVALARPPFIQLALVLAPIAVIGTLAFVRYVERRR
jgi:multisubunit Na+/H+ antiporter MnhF subunit